MRFKMIALMGMVMGMVMTPEWATAQEADSIVGKTVTCTSPSKKEGEKLVVRVKYRSHSRDGYRIAFSLRDTDREFSEFESHFLNIVKPIQITSSNPNRLNFSVRADFDGFYSYRLEFEGLDSAFLTVQGQAMSGRQPPPNYDHVKLDCSSAN